MQVVFFETPVKLREWFRAHHATDKELWVGFRKRHTNTPGITWPEAVDEALCVGWIDGIRKRIDESSYKIRFTPRRAKSIWSAVNIRRAEFLAKEQRMLPAGHRAFAARKEKNSGIYSYEQRSAELPNRYAKLLQKNKPAWNFFAAQPPSYRKMIVWWIVSAKQEPTRLKRLDKLLAASADRRRL